MDLLDLLDETAMLVPGVPEPTAVVELRRAARQFCQDSRIWQRPFQVYTVAGISGYEVDSAENAALLGIEWLSLNGERLDGRTSQATMANHASDAKQHKPTTYYHTPGSELVLSPVPDDQYVLHGMQALQPYRTSDRIPDWMGDKWGDAIIALAGAWLFLMPEKDWTDAQSASVQMQRYRGYLAQAKKEASGDHEPATRVVAYGGL